MMIKKILLCTGTLFFSAQALKLDRVILATDTNPDYIEFWPAAAKAWKEIVGVQPTLALIAPKETVIDESLGDVIRFEPIEGVSTALYAQAIRLLLPAYFPNEVCITSDIDLIPLNKDYFVHSIAAVSDDSFVVYRDGAYYNDLTKFPMMFVAAKGKLFQEIFNIQDINTIPYIIKEWSTKKLGWSTDEILLYDYLTTWKSYKNKCVKLGHYVEKRIDRSYWTYDTNLVKNHFYIDAHCPRPYSRYKKEIDAIIQITIDTKKQNTSSLISRPLPGGEQGTHVSALIAAVVNTDGPVLEMGAGDFSTPLLHALCAPKKRLLLSAETEKKWLDLFIDLQNEWHHFIYVPVYEDDRYLNPQPNKWDVIGSDIHWSVVLIDHRPGERRAEDIRRLRDHTDIFVVHDTENSCSGYCYTPVLNSFKYKYIYDRYTTTTTLVSDTIDVAQFFNN